MKTISLMILEKRLEKYKKFIEILIVIFFTMSFFQIDNYIYKIFYYFFSIFSQILTIAYYFYIKKIEKNIFFKYFIIIILLLFLMFIFYFNKIENQAILNRIFPLLSLFGIIVIGGKEFENNRKSLIQKITKIFITLSLIINIDFAIFLLTKKVYIWKPIIYLGYRCQGPFWDPNFLAMYAATFFLLVYSSENNYLNLKSKKIALSIILSTIFFTGSLSTFIFLPLVIVLHKIKIVKNIRDNRKKMFFILILYFTSIIFYNLFSEEISNCVIIVLKNIYGDSESATIKFISLESRILVQIKALKLICLDWWGKGPRQSVPYLGIDPHNSYIGMIFEQGIIGFLILYISLSKNCKKKMGKYIGSYLMLSALLINVHLLSIYSLFLLIQFL